MSTATPKTPEALVRDYHRARAKIWGSEELSWEKKSRLTRELAVKYDKARKEAERSAA